MALFFELDPFFYFLAQPVENSLIRGVANVHCDEMIPIEPCLKEQSLEQLLLDFRLARADDDEGVGVVFSGAEDVFQDPASAWPA